MAPLPDREQPGPWPRIRVFPQPQQGQAKKLAGAGGHRLLLFS